MCQMDQLDLSSRAQVEASQDQEKTDRGRWEQEAEYQMDSPPRPAEVGASRE